MGYGAWTTQSFLDYASERGTTLDSLGRIDVSTAQEFYTSSHLQKELDPKNVMRECKDTDEHPNTVPVILALDVTGSMGQTAVEVAKSLGVIMEQIMESRDDVEFLVMGIGDLAYDTSPIQMSQFESDIRIIESLDKIYMEFGGGGNFYESYTAAWYMGALHTDLDCWKRGVKGIIITLGDEKLNPYLPYKMLERVTGDDLQADVDTKELYKMVADKYDVYHVCVDHHIFLSSGSCAESFMEVLPADHVFISAVNGVPNVIAEIVNRKSCKASEGISW